MEERLHARLPFLWVDESADRSRRVRAGEVLVSPVGDHSPIRVPKGLIHDWIGATLIPNAGRSRLQPVQGVLQATRYRFEIARYGWPRLPILFAHAEQVALRKDGPRERME
jgi:hypothetical protein